MNLADRIARLEARLRPLALYVPVVYVNPWRELTGSDDPIRHWCCNDGRRWDREPGESDEAFMARAKAGALSGRKGPGPVAEIRLSALRPQITREQWMERHGPDSGR